MSGREEAELDRAAIGAEAVALATLFERQARVCQALADPKRLAIIHLLRDHERTVGELVAALGVRQPNVSQHLMVMRELGIVTVRREANQSFYSLAHPAIGQACDLVQQVLAAQISSETGS